MEESALRRWTPLLQAIFLLAAPLLVYWPAVNGGFVWDDDFHFSENSNMEGLGGLVKIWTDLEFYYPLTSTTFWMGRQIWGLATWPYHVLNIFLHGLNAILLWRILRRLEVPGAWLAGAVFAVHPVLAQSVAWMTELKNCQSGFFYLGALYFWTRFAESKDSGEKDTWRWYAFALGTFALALVSKTSTVTLPFALLLVQAWRTPDWKKWGWIASFPFFALSLATGVLTVVLHSEHIEEDPEWVVLWPERIAIAGHTVWFYLSKIYWPTNLSFVYPRWSIPTDQWQSFIPTGALIVSILGLVAIPWKKLRGLRVAFAYFVTALIPVMGFFSMYYARYSHVADHWQYLASMGIIAWTVGTLAWIFDPTRRAPAQQSVFRIVGASGGALLLMILGMLTWGQAHAYQSEEALWRDTLSKNPGAWLAGLNYGNLLIAEGRYDEAEPILLQALEAYPRLHEAHNSLGQIYHERARRGAGSIDAAIGRYQSSIELRPNYESAHKNLGMAYMEKGDINNAIAEWEEVLKTLPNDEQTLVNLGIAYLNTGRPEAAVPHFRHAVELFPDVAQLRSMLATAEQQIALRKN